MDDSGIQLSIRTEADVERKIREFAKSKEAKNLGWTDEKIESIIGETADLIRAIHAEVTGDKYYDEWAQREPTVRVDWRDGVEKPTVTWSRANIEYKYDMSADLLCINNEGLESVLASPTMVDLMLKINEPARSYKEGFTSEDYLRLYETLRDMGFVVPCKGCFDAAVRLKMLPTVSKKFIERVNQVIDERNADPQAFDDKVRADAGSDATITGLPGSAHNIEEAIRTGIVGDNLTEHINWAQLMSAEGQTKALSDWGGIFRAWERTGAGRPKDKLLPEPWSGDIVSTTTTIIGKYGEKTPSYRDINVNQGTGLRRNSHSEFRPILAIDEIQFMREAYIRGLTVFKYMKELDDVRLFGQLGVKFNMSFFPAFVEGAPAAGLDANGNYIAAEESVGGREFEYVGADGKTHYDGMRGWREAQKYLNKDVSLSSVVFSIPHLIKSLTDVPTTADPTGMWGSLIPFHATGATATSLKKQGLGQARALGLGHGFEEAMTDYGKGVTNFEAVQNDRFGDGWVILEGKKAGTNVDPGHKLEFASGTHYYNEGLGLHLFSSKYIFDSELKDHADEFASVKALAEKYGHSYSIDYNDKVREIGTDTAYKDAADFYIQRLREIGLVPRFDFDVPERVFLQMCADANVDPNHPKLGWRGPGNTWSPVDSDAYYSLFCDYGMIDPKTGKLAPHNPVGVIDENGNRVFRLPENTIDIIKDGIKRYGERKSREEGRVLDAIEEFAKRSVAEGKLSQEDADAILADAKNEIPHNGESVSYSIEAGGPISDLGFSIVGDKDLIRELDASEKVTGIREVVLNSDGSMSPPMAGNLGRAGMRKTQDSRRETAKFFFNQWERSDENPDLADEDGKIKLIKTDNAKRGLVDVDKVDYNPYNHLRLSPVNKQFKDAWKRPDLIFIECEVPKSEVPDFRGIKDVKDKVGSPYHAEKAALPVGIHDWNGGPLMLSRYDKPVKQIDWEKVADAWAKDEDFKNNGIPFDIVNPQLLQPLVDRGMNIIAPGKGEDKNEAYKAWKNGDIEAYESWRDTGKAPKRSNKLTKRQQQNAAIDKATAFVTGKPVKEVTAERREAELREKEQLGNLFDDVLKNGFNDVNLQEFNNYVDQAKDDRRKRIFERLPQTVVRTLLRSERANKVNAALSRAAESAVAAPERATRQGRIEADRIKKRLLESWAKASGVWYTDIADIPNIASTEPFDGGTESDVYASNDPGVVIKVNRGKSLNRKHATDIDQIALFNFVFPASAYTIIGYGDFGEGFRTIMTQPKVKFNEDALVDVDDRMGFIRDLKAKPLNKEATAFSYKDYIAADLGGRNMVRDDQGELRVLDADMRLFTKDIGGPYTIPNVDDTIIRPSIKGKEQDKEYMDAVESGDTDKAQELVDKAAEKAMPKSVVRDRDGHLVPVYHQTNSTRYINRETGQDWDLLDWREKEEWEERDDWDDYWEEKDFYSFDRRNARTSIEMPAYFFSPEYDPNHEYGKRTISAYINLTNPVINPEIENAGVYNDSGERAMQKYIEQGYDGFIRYKEDGSVGEYGVFDASQIKSSDPVTYDDAGNVIPLSERFNQGNNDIRFSIVGGSNGIADIASDLFDRYENQDGGDHPWMSENELIQKIEEELPYGAKTKDIFSKIDEYRRLDMEDFSEGRRDFSGSEKDAVFDEILSGLDKLGKDQAGIRFSIVNQTQNGFISNAEASLDRIKMEKATPEQWVKMLEKEGGLKAGEDKWLGLSDWLNSKKGSVTKQEIAEFIAENRIQIEEQEYYDPQLEETYLDKKIPGFSSAFGVDIADEEANVWIKDEDEARVLYERETGESAESLEDWELEDFGRNLAADSQGENASRQINGTRLDFTTEGLDNKREIALTVPTVEPWNESDNVHFGDAGNGRAVAWVRFGETWTEMGVGDAPIEVEYTGPEAVDEPHRRAIDGILLNWNDSEPVMRNERKENQFSAAKSMYENSLRDNYYEYQDAERTLVAQTLAVLDDIKAEDFNPIYKRGDKVLVIDEIQSKRHQEGREKGYKTNEPVWTYDPNVPIPERERYSARKVGANWFVYKDGEIEAANIAANSEDEAIAKFVQTGAMYEHEIDKRIPSAPFEKNWHELAMKRMLRLAAEEGYDYVAWTTGEQQAERYNIGGVVNRIVAGVDSQGKRHLVLYPKDRAFIAIEHDDNGNVVKVQGDNGAFSEAKNISDIVGKELAERVLQVTEPGSSEEFNGDGLKFGGEGMKGFYDDILPRFMNKYGKKWGVKVSDITLPNVEEAGRTMHAVPVTQEMKESVMQGQTMFSIKGSDEAIRSVDKSGLPGIIGEEDTRRMYWDSIRMLPENVRKQIMEKGLSNGLDFEKSVKEYLGKLAEGGTENDETGLLRVLYDQIREESGNPDLSDADIRYMIWRDARERSGNDDVLSLASEIAMKRRFGAGEEQFRPSVTREFGERVDASREKLDNTVTSANAELKETTKAEKKEAADGDIKAIVKAMRGQRNYDRSTVDSIVKYAKEILKGGNVDSMTRTELTKLLTLVGKATGKAPSYVDKYADGMIDVLLDNIVKKEKNSLDKLIKVKDKKTDKSGVEVMGKLDKTGQTTIAALRAYKDSDPDRIQERLSEVSDLLSSPDDAIRENAWAEYSGLELAQRYHDEVKVSEEEADDLRRDIREAKSTVMSPEAYREFVKETTHALRENKIQRIESMQSISSALGEGMKKSIEAAREFRKAKEARVEEIHHDANRDLFGTETLEHRQEGRVDNIINNSFVRMMLSPLATFDQMLRQLGRHSVNGEGYLWNRYMRGWVDATENAFVGFEEQTKVLDDKVSEVFGKKMIWSDLYDMERKLDKEHEKKTGRPHIARFIDGGEMREHELTSGNLLYIYMVNKMTDGRMKLRKMGITQEDVDQIKAELDPRFIQLADWLQDEYFVTTRNKYNAVHEQLFGAPMAAIENYFPLKINKMARIETVEPGGANFGENALPSTTTGAIVKRRTNSLALDIMNADAFSVVIEHLQQMEDWAAFAPLREDMKSLLSYKTFRNKVMNMKTVYGSGEALWNNFRNAVDLAAGVYKPKIDRNSIDKIALNVAKGVTGAKIAFRVQTALKQMLSAPAFLSDADLGELANSLSHPMRSWNWCWDNLPVFRKRWKSRIAGDTRLEKTESDWETWNNEFVQALGQWGMTPNAFVDALTVSIGAKAMYETKLKKYKELGLPDAIAERKAKQDATILYNQTQQSNEGAFVSVIQKDRTFLAATLSTYRNSSMGYTRQTVDAVRNFARMGQKGRKDLVEFATRQRTKEGADEGQARRFSEKEYDREKTRNAVRVGVFAFLLPFLWNLGVGPLLYTVFGKNKKRKEKILHDVALHTVAGPIEGLAGGNVISEAWNLKMSGGNFRNFSLGALPAVSDTKSVLQTSDTDPVKGLNQVIDLVVQSKFGVNPQTVTDVVVAIMDASNGDLGTAKEMALLLMRVTQFPQSAIEDFYFDEIEMSAKDASKATPQELIDRYAKYKVNRSVPLTGWRYTDEARADKEKKQVTQIKKKLKERKEDETE